MRVQSCNVFFKLCSVCDSAIALSKIANVNTCSEVQTKDVDKVGKMIKKAQVIEIADWHHSRARVRVLLG